MVKYIPTSTRGVVTVILRKRIFTQSRTVNLTPMPRSAGTRNRPRLGAFSEKLDNEQPLDTVEDRLDDHQRDNIIDRHRHKPLAKGKQAGAKPGQTIDEAASKRADGYHYYGKQARHMGFWGQVVLEKS